MLDLSLLGGKPPGESIHVFVAQGYGEHLLRLILHSALGWQEKAVIEVVKDQASDVVPRFQLSGPLPQLLWIAPVTSRHALWKQLRPWQLVNRFPGSAAISSKMRLLHNLRFLLHGSATKGSPTPCRLRHTSMDAFFPRSYDLQRAQDLLEFVLDFAVTRAEAVLRRKALAAAPVLDGSGPQEPPSVQLISVATALLDRLASTVDARR